MIITSLRRYWIFARAYHLGDKAMLDQMRLLALTTGKGAILAKKFVEEQTMSKATGTDTS